jgi:hypothetical protein
VRRAPPSPSERGLQQPAERVARGHDALHVPPRQRGVHRQRERFVGGPFGLGQRHAPPELGHPVHRRLDRHPAVDSPGPYGPRERVPVGPPVAGYPHHVLLIGVPVAPFRRAHSPQSGVEVAGPLPALRYLVARRLRLLPVLQHQQPVPLPEFMQPRHVGRPSEPMDGDDGGRPRSHGRLHSGRFHAVGHRVYVREHRQRTDQGNGLGDFHVPEGRHDDLVTGSDTGRPEHCSSTHAHDAGRAT